MTAPLSLFILFCNSRLTKSSYCPEVFSSKPSQARETQWNDLSPENKELVWHLKLYHEIHL